MSWLINSQQYKNTRQQYLKQQREAKNWLQTYLPKLDEIADLDIFKDDKNREELLKIIEERNTHAVKNYIYASKWLAVSQKQKTIFDL